MFSFAKFQKLSVDCYCTQFRFFIFSSSLRDIWSILGLNKQIKVALDHPERGSLQREALYLDLLNIITEIVCSYITVDQKFILVTLSWICFKSFPCQIWTDSGCNTCCKTSLSHFSPSLSKLTNHSFLQSLSLSALMPAHV